MTTKLKIHLLDRCTGQVGPDEWDSWTNVVDVDQNETVESAFRKIMTIGNNNPDLFTGQWGFELRVEVEDEKK